MPLWLLLIPGILLLGIGTLAAREGDPMLGPLLMIAGFTLSAIGLSVVIP